VDETKDEPTVPSMTRTAIGDVHSSMEFVGYLIRRALHRDECYTEQASRAPFRMIDALASTGSDPPGPLPEVMLLARAIGINPLNAYILGNVPQ
jgi:hypothetical protein